MQVTAAEASTSTPIESVPGALGAHGGDGRGLTLDHALQARDDVVGTSRTYGVAVSQDATGRPALHPGRRTGSTGRLRRPGPGS